MRRPATALATAAVMLLSACSGAADSGGENGQETAPTAVAPRGAGSTSSGTTTSTSTSSTTTTSTSTTTTLPGPAGIEEVRGVAFTPRLELQVVYPRAGGPWPVVVLLHGGGWVGGEPDDVAPLAQALAAQGTVVFNAPYRVVFGGGGYPASFEDAACAVRFARQEAGRYRGDPGRVVLAGYSAGAHIGAVVALAGDEYQSGCLAGDGTPLPDGFVGIAGPYDVDAFGGLLGVFFGAPPEEAPERWERGNPLKLVERRPELPIRLVVGERDPLELLSTSFHLALTDAGHDSQLEVVSGATHSSIDDPDADGGAAVAAVLELARA